MIQLLMSVALWCQVARTGTLTTLAATDKNIAEQDCRDRVMACMKIGKYADSAALDCFVKEKVTR